MIISTSIAVHSLTNLWWSGLDTQAFRLFSGVILRTRRPGFTLVELVIVIAIIGILASLSIPKFINLSGAAKESATKAGLGSLRSVLAIKYAQSATGGSAATFPATVAAADFAGDMPRNAVTNATATSIVGLTNTVSGTTTHASAGFWYVSGPTNSAVYGKAGAYSDGTIDTSAY